MPPPASVGQSDDLSATEQELVRAALAGTGAPTDPRHWTLEDGGGSHRVVLAGDRVAVRVSRHPQAADYLVRSTALVDALPELGVALPRSLGPVASLGTHRAVATCRVPGDPSQHRVDPTALAVVLDSLAAVDTRPLTEFLSPPLAYGGGPDWLDLQHSAVLPRIPARARAAARRAVDALAAAEPVPERSVHGGQLVHGDLAGANLRWQSGRVVGLIDWDLATAYDPALDLACLAEWHGWDTVEQLADGATVRRARVQQDCFALHTIAHVIITRGAGDPAVSTAVERAVARLEG